MWFIDRQRKKQRKETYLPNALCERLKKTGGFEQN